MQFKGLQILLTRAGKGKATRGVVRFAAFYEYAGRQDVQEETSTFVKEHGAWFYVDAL